MADALVVLNAGSSSIKFSLYAIEAPTLALDVRGQIEGLPEKPQFIARDAAGVIIGQRAWAANALDHVGGTAFLLHFIEHDLARHRVVARSEEHTSELQSRFDLVCRLLLEKKNRH